MSEETTKTPATFMALQHARRDIELAELRHRLEQLAALLDRGFGATERRLHVLELAEAGRAGKQ